MEPGKVAIMHHHLHPGGVTRIIDSQVKSLSQDHPNIRLRVVCGQTDDPYRYKEQGVEVIVHEELNYLFDEHPSPAKINTAIARLNDFLKELLDEDEIIHFHNLNLGKNPLVTYSLYRLAEEGRLVLNHAHDFAEDRPANMAFLEYILRDGLHMEPSMVMYPRNLENYHFAVINSGDQQRLLNQGIDEGHIALLPNPVSVPNTQSLPDKTSCKKKITATFSLDPQTKIVTYPVRVIRRKNIGELILLSELFRSSAVFLVTLAPKNPLELEHYNQWKTFCQENHLNNVLFEAGEKIDFPRLVKGSDLCITTSIREGFGMTYMEPWLYHTPVVGRKIDYITRDFLQTGMVFPGLYNQIIIPGRDSDFKDLPVQDQMYEILKISHDTKRQEELFRINPALHQLLETVDPQTIEDNIHRIVQYYSLETYGKKLVETYRRLSQSVG